MNVLQQLKKPLEVKQEFDVLGFLIDTGSNGIKLVRSEGDLEFSIDSIELHSNEVYGEFVIKNYEAFYDALISYMKIELQKQYEKTKSVILMLISEWEKCPNEFVKSKKYPNMFSKKKIKVADCLDIDGTSLHSLGLYVNLGDDSIYLYDASPLDIFQKHDNRLYLFSLEHYKRVLKKLEKANSDVYNELHSKNIKKTIKKEVDAGICCTLTIEEADKLIQFKHTQDV